VVLDLETLTISPFIHDYMNTLRTLWNDKDLREEFIRYIFTKFEHVKNFREMFISFALENAVHHLTGVNELEENSIELIKYIIELDKLPNIPILLRRIVFNLQSKLFKKFNNKKLNAICYHNISNENNRYTVSLEDFIKQIEKIEKTDRFINTTVMEKRLNGELAKSNELLITFDDGFKEIKTALEFLKNKNIPALIFVLSNPENANRDELNNNSKILSLDEVKNLSDIGFIIGCHSATHANLTLLNDKELEKEIIDSKITLKKALGKPVDYFAYPKGKYNEKVIEYVKKAGYKAAFSIEPGCIDKNSNIFALPRYIVDSTHSLNEFPALYSYSTGMLKKFLNKYKIWERFFQ
jgi:peptidoglycan/xylan/chitin deacetylase (PgdA/CDA1 family)